MSRRDDRISIRHMLDHALEARAMARGRTRADLENDRMFQLALTRLIEIIGEAAARVSKPTRDRYPGIPWAEIIGMRHRLIHGYDVVDKVRKGWRNLAIRPETGRRLMNQVEYTLLADEAPVRPRPFADRRRLQETVTAILCKYMDTFYRRRREHWETQVMEYRPLDEDDPNLAFNRGVAREDRPAYVVQVRRSDRALIEAIQKLLEEEKRLREEENQGLPRIAFDRHLYLPLPFDKACKRGGIVV